MALLWLLLLWVSCSASKTEAVDSVQAVESEVRDPRIPSLAYALKRTVRAEVNYYWGLEQKGTIFYSQIHQESDWNPNAESKYASGLAQFTPDTAKWISGLYPKDLGDNNPLDAKWAIRACIKYDKFLYDRASYAAEEDSRWRFTLSGYNGGEGWVKRDRKLCYEAPCCCNQNVWTGNVENFSNRAGWAIKENRDYPKKIMDKWFPMYERAGFI